MAITAQRVAAGFFGKVPSHGDFVARRLPPGFLVPWDAWLQAGLAESRALLGEAWLPLYLNSPVWRFAFDAGVCGPQAWAGLVMPSVDRVGRYFPMTLAAALSGPRAAGQSLVPDEVWYARLDALALSCLDEGFSLEAFDAGLRALAPPALRGAVAATAAPVVAQARFWRDRGPGHGPASLVFRGMPAPVRYTAMLGDSNDE